MPAIVKPRDTHGRWTRHTQTAADVALAPHNDDLSIASTTDEAGELVRLSFSKSTRVREAVIDNPNTPASVIHRYLERAIHDKARLLRSPALSTADLRELATTGDRKNLAHIARRSYIDEATMEACAQRDMIAATHIASRGDASGPVLARIAATNPHRQVLETLAKNRHAPASARAIAGQRAADIRAALQ